VKIATIALDAGFGDLSYFNRTFRRRFGVAPSELRAAADTTVPGPALASALASGPAGSACDSIEPAVASRIRTRGQG
jgi:AraC-like DNA-binding protein